VTPHGSCKNRCITSIIRVTRNGELGKTLEVTANVVASSSILYTLMMEAIRSSETWVLTRAWRRHTPEEGILHRFSRILPHALRSCACALKQLPLHTLGERRHRPETLIFSFETVYLWGPAGCIKVVSPFSVCSSIALQLLLVFAGKLTFLKSNIFLNQIL
jgi:hypothetical protein